MNDGVNIIPSMACPSCGYVMNRSTHTVGADGAPGPNDLSLCIQCGELAKFTGKRGAVTGMKALTAGETFHIYMAMPELACKCAMIKDMVSRLKKAGG